MNWRSYKKATWGVRRCVSCTIIDLHCQFSFARVSCALFAAFLYYPVLCIFDRLSAGSCQEKGVRHVVFGGASWAWVELLLGAWTTISYYIRCITIHESCLLKIRNPQIPWDVLQKSTFRFEMFISSSILPGCNGALTDVPDVVEAGDPEKGQTKTRSSQRHSTRFSDLLTVGYWLLNVL